MRLWVASLLKQALQESQDPRSGTKIPSFKRLRTPNQQKIRPRIKCLRAHTLLLARCGGLHHGDALNEISKPFGPKKALANVPPQKSGCMRFLQAALPCIHSDRRLQKPPNLSTNTTSQRKFRGPDQEPTDIDERRSRSPTS